MGMVYAHKKGKLPAASDKVRAVAKHISTQDARDFAKTKHKGLVEKKESSTMMGGMASPASRPIVFSGGPPSLRPAGGGNPAAHVNAASTAGPTPGGAANAQVVQSQLASTQPQTPPSPQAGFLPNSQGQILYPPGQGPVTEQLAIPGKIAKTSDVRSVQESFSAGFIRACLSRGVSEEDTLKLAAFHKSALPFVPMALAGARAAAPHIARAGGQFFRQAVPSAARWLGGKLPGAAKWLGSTAGRGLGGYGLGFGADEIIQRSTGQDLGLRNYMGAAGLGFGAAGPLARMLPQRLGQAVRFGSGVMDPMNPLRTLGLGSAMSTTSNAMRAGQRAGTLGAAGGLAGAAGGAVQDTYESRPWTQMGRGLQSLGGQMGQGLQPLGQVWEWAKTNPQLAIALISLLMGGGSLLAGRPGMAAGLGGLGLGTAAMWPMLQQQFQQNPGYAQQNLQTPGSYASMPGQPAGATAMTQQPMLS